MLPKKNRLGRKSIEQLFKKSVFVVCPNLTLRFFIESTQNNPKISFLVPKTIVKQATKRNLLRRRGYLALEKYVNQFPNGFIGVFVFKKYEDSVLILENEIKNLLNKIN